MKFLIRIAFALLFLFLIVINSFAGNGSVRPVNYLSGNIQEAIHKVDSFLSVKLAASPADANKEEDAVAARHGESGSASSRARICSCQILNLESSNYDHRHIALFAEKTNHGSSSDFSVAKNRIEKEKKHLKRMFYDKIEVVAEVSAVGSCHSMYVQMKSGDRNLKMYEILNADIR
jgi:hypothetical protein